ncbi:SpoIIE family protein phosphatase [Streptomyces griseoaurantiacus]|uniref:SpoIIE family protein phosphatase n=1 Tax=Streptomyces griseoaurantiacus TaxID=68213 RepID=UPI003F4CF742
MRGAGRETVTASTSDVQPATVLVVDDNETNRYVLATWLRRAGHTVVGVGTGEEGLAYLRGSEPAPDIAIVDVRLPDMSGFDVSERIKQDTATGHLPVIQISAAAISPEDHIEGLSRGADAYLDQPLDPGELVATVTATLRYARARQRAERLARRLITLNQVTLQVYSATEFPSFASRVTSGAAEVLSGPASAVFLSPLAEAVQATVDGPRGVVGLHPVRPALLEELSALSGLGQAAGVRLLHVPAERWRSLSPAHDPRGEVALALSRTKRGRPPVAVVVPATAVRSADDERLLQQLANTGALALEALRTYSEEHALGLALQRSFLPKELPSVPGVDLAVRYQPASEHAEIGGDFYEAVETADGLLLAIGDVVGHSVTAATVMGEVRHALRAYAIEGHPPQRILEALERLLGQSQPGITVTLCLVLVDSEGRRLLVANAGHIPPVVAEPRVAPRFHEPHGPLLGLGLPQPAPTTVPLPHGGRLVMVTDGLVEVRTAPLDVTLAAFRETVAGGPEDIEELCDLLLDRFGQNKDDDIAVIAASFSRDTTVRQPR